MDIKRMLSDWLKSFFIKEIPEVQKEDVLPEPEYEDWQPVDEWYAQNFLLPDSEAIERNDRLHGLPPVVTVSVGNSKDDFGGVFCPFHKRWEEVKRIDSQTSLTSESGCRIKGRIVPVSLEEREWLHFKKVNAAALGWHIVQEQPCDELAVYTEILSLEIEWEKDSQGKAVSVQVTPEVRQEKYIINFNGVSIKSRPTRGFFDEPFSPFGKIQPQPVHFPEKIEIRILDLMRETFKRQFGIAPTYTNVKGYDRIAAYLLYPFDMNLPCLFCALTRPDYEVFYERLRALRQEEDAPEELVNPKGAGGGWRGIFSRTATNNFPLLCRIYGLKPSKGLRKVYTRNPVGVLVHFAMREFGFTDVNIISDYYYRGDDIGLTAKAETPGDILGNSRSYSLLGDFYKKDGKFYISKLLEEKGERAAAFAMERLVRRYSSSSGDVRRIIDDALKMYRSYYDDLTPELRRDMIVNGPTKAVHDRLSAFITALKRKFRLFAVTPEQVALEGVSGKMIISLARNTDVLQETGSALHNCVASYADAAAKGEVSVFTGVIEGKTVACIDVRHSKAGFSIYQALGKYNRILEADEQMMILSWVRDKNITVACTHLQQAMREEKRQKPKVPVWELVHKKPR